MKYTLLQSTSKVPKIASPSAPGSIATKRSRWSSRNKILTSVLLQILILLSTSSSSKSFTFTVAADISDFNPSNPENNSNQFQILSEKREQLINYTKQNIIQPIYGQYQQLSPKGKFLSTAFVGFTTSRFTVSTTIKIAKYFGAAFIM